VPGDPFSIDGVVTDTSNSGISGGYKIPPCDGPPAGTVQNPANAPQACKQIDPNGSSKELGPINGSSTKIGPINLAAKPMLGDTNPNAQVDLNAAWTHSKIVMLANPQTQVLEPHVFFYFGWRRDSASGSGFISLEIEKSAAGGSSDGCKYDTFTSAQLVANCNPWAGRQAGDFILLWDQNGSATNIVLAAFSGNPGEGQNLNFPDCSHGGNCIDLTSQNVAFAVYGTNCGTGFVAGQCGEMSIDLTAAGVFPTGSNATQCVTLANTIPGTVTGNSNTADYKDVILAPFPSISNCGTLTVTKTTLDPNGNALDDTTSIFGYTVGRSGGGNVRYDLDQPNHKGDGPVSQKNIIRPNCFDNSGGVVSQCTPGQTVTATGQPGIKNGETQTHVDLISGSDYTLGEQLIATAYQLYSITCVLNGTPYVLSAQSPNFPVEANSTTACTIVNKFVKTTPGYASKQQVTLQDLAKLTSINPGGSGKPTTVKISLWKSNDCTGAANKINEFTASLTYAADGKSAESAFSSGYVVDTGGTTTIYWAFTYDGDSLNNGLTVADTCKTDPAKESVTVTLVPTQP